MLSTDLSTEKAHFARIYVIVIHFGDPTVTDRAVRSLLQGTVVPEKIVIIDQAGTPYTLPSGSEYGVHLIRPTDNNGYAGGVTLGLGSLLTSGIGRNDIVISMNNDCVVGAETISVVQTRSASVSQPTLIGIQTGMVDLVSGRADLGTQPPTWRSRTYVDGAFLVASYDTWLLLKGMPDRYFLYWEDVALSWQAAARGIVLVTWPDIHVTHAASTETSEDKLYYLVRNGAVVLETLTPWPWRLYWWFKNRLRLVYHRDAGMKRALADAAQRRLGKRTV